MATDPYGLGDAGRPQVNMGEKWEYVREILLYWLLGTMQKLDDGSGPLGG